MKVKVKKKNFITVFLAIILSLFLLLVVVVYDFTKEFNIYINIIDNNWDIQLPENLIEFYKDDSGPSFNGDGDRYHVFKFENNDDFTSSIQWCDNKNLLFQCNVEGILEKLNIPKEFYPNFQCDYEYYFKINLEDSSEIYIISIPDLKKVYVIEHFQ